MKRIVYALNFLSIVIFNFVSACPVCTERVRGVSRPFFYSEKDRRKLDKLFSDLKEKKAASKSIFDRMRGDAL